MVLRGRSMVTAPYGTAGRSMVAVPYGTAGRSIAAGPCGTAGTLDGSQSLWDGCSFQLTPVQAGSVGRVFVPRYRGARPEAHRKPRTARGPDAPSSIMAPRSRRWVSRNRWRDRLGPKHGNSPSKTISGTRATAQVVLLHENSLLHADFMPRDARSAPKSRFSLPRNGLSAPK